MDKREMYDHFDQMENDLLALQQNLHDVHDCLETLRKRNMSLEIENQNLRERLDELTKTASDAGDEKTRLSKPRLNLEKLYEEGFHVCNYLYGKRRENDEECAFCLEVIYGTKK